MNRKMRQHGRDQGEGKVFDIALDDACVVEVIFEICKIHNYYE